MYELYVVSLVCFRKQITHLDDLHQKIENQVVRHQKNKGNQGKTEEDSHLQSQKLLPHQGQQQSH